MSHHAQLHNILEFSKCEACSVDARQVKHGKHTPTSCVTRSMVKWAQKQNQLVPEPIAGKGRAGTWTPTAHALTPALHLLWGALPRFLQHSLLLAMELVQVQVQSLLLATASSHQLAWAELLPQDTGQGGCWCRMWASMQGMSLQSPGAEETKVSVLPLRGPMPKSALNNHLQLDTPLLFFSAYAV